MIDHVKRTLRQRKAKSFAEFWSRKWMKGESNVPFIKWTYLTFWKPIVSRIDVTN